MPIYPRENQSSLLHIESDAGKMQAINAHFTVWFAKIIPQIISSRTGVAQTGYSEFT